MPRGFIAALPFCLSFSLAPLVWLGAVEGGLWLAVLPVYAFLGMTVLDALAGANEANLDPSDETGLFWHKAITWIWLPVQLAMIFGALGWIAAGGMESPVHAVYLMIGVGVVTGGVGINYAHELMHQKNRWERGLGEGLMISVLYGHFVSEHLYVHHRHVATPKDVVTARYNESFYAFFARVLPGCVVSSWRAEAERMRRRRLPVSGLANPFWRYLGGAGVVLALAYGIGGWTGVGLYAVQAFMAVFLLEQTNYMEHYGLLRKRLETGKYEPTRPHHSWNAPHRVTNYLLINLQRHSDHHFKPDRRFPLLQTYEETEAPQLPFGYPFMGLMSLNPWLWRRVMNPKVRRWRALHYPEVTDWSGERV